jgi:uncharacterized protein GlcG (DUF336 family)
MARRGAVALGLCAALSSAAFGAAPALAQAPSRAAACPIPHDKLQDALRKAVKASGGPSNGGFDNHEWAAVVARDGTVCALAFSGDSWTDQWLGSRAIAAEKASTANAFSLSQRAIATANLYAGAQPGGFLFGIASSAPPNDEAIAAGDPRSYGGASDPMVGKRLGGIIVFGGGLALYGDDGLVGGLGVSGDSSCADHNVAWRIRHQLGLDHVPAGVNPNKKDAIVYDIGADGRSASGFGHPRCKGTEAQIATDLGAGVDANAVR